MRTVALCWELGAGFGHLTTLSPVAEALRRRGNRVVMIARNLWTARQVFRDAGVSLFQAPFRHGQGLQYDKTPTFAYILHNIGFSDSVGLAGLAAGWRSLFETIRPDLIIADHSPTALLAARGLGIPSLVWGTGFYCPPNETPLPPMMPSLSGEQAMSVEAAVLRQANEVLSEWGAEPMSRVADLYHDGPRKFLLTFPELDHYPDRRGDPHRGYWPYRPGAAPDWPDGTGSRVFVYLKPFLKLPEVLDAISKLRTPTIVYIDGADPRLCDRFGGPTLRFADQLLDLRLVASEAALSVTNANIGTMTALLLGGVPQLCLPLTLEQLLVGQAVERMGAGLIVAPGTSVGAIAKRLLSDDRFRAAAGAFAERHRGFDTQRQLDDLLDECDAQVS